MLSFLLRARSWPTALASGQLAGLCGLPCPLALLSLQAPFPTQRPPSFPEGGAHVQLRPLLQSEHSGWDARQQSPSGTILGVSSGCPRRGARACPPSSGCGWSSVFSPAPFSLRLMASRLLLPQHWPWLISRGPVLHLNPQDPHPGNPGSLTQHPEPAPPARLLAPDPSLCGPPSVYTRLRALAPLPLSGTCRPCHESRSADAPGLLCPQPCPLA